MADLLSQIEEILESAVLTALQEEADERGLQLRTASKIKKDQRPLQASERADELDEVEDEDEDEKEEEEVKTKTSDAGGDMSRRQVNVPDELPSTLTVDMIVQGIDSLRSARSLKDPDVFADLEEYWEGLESAEKVALLAYINGLAETLIGGEGDRSLDPSDPPYNVQMASEPRQDKEPPKAIERPGQQTASSDTPIVVGGQ